MPSPRRHRGGTRGPRQVAALVGFEGLSHGEAAAVLGIGVEACRNRWQRLRERRQGEVALDRWSDS